MSGNANEARSERVAALALALVVLAVFGSGALRRGFYYDDSQWITTLARADLGTVWRILREYVPGRPLFVFWQYLVFRLVPDPGAHPAALHLLQAALDALTAAVFFRLLRRYRLPAPVALAAAALFAFWPIHGETHFWNTSLVGNLIETLLVLTFLMTSAVERRRGWVQVADTAAFALALLTYDQALLAMVAVLWQRVRAEKSLRAHLPHLAFLGIYVLLKLRGAAGPAPALSSDTPRNFWSHLAQTLSLTIGAGWSRQVLPLYEKATRGDVLLALAAAAVLTALAFRLISRQEFTPALRPIARLGLTFALWTFLPAWLWYPSPRHYYLPSIGLFVFVAACLAKLPRTLALAPAGAALWFFAAASLGEGRYWEEAFQVKKRLLTDLRPDLEGKEVLALENFPNTLGPAHLIYPQDARFGPRLLFGDGLRLPADFTGDPLPAASSSTRISTITARKTSAITGPTAPSSCASPAGKAADSAMTRTLFAPSPTKSCRAVQRPRTAPSRRARSSSAATATISWPASASKPPSCPRPSSPPSPATSTATSPTAGATSSAAIWPASYRFC